MALVVRSVVVVDLVGTTLFGSIAWLFSSHARHPSEYLDECHGRHAWVCELIKSTKPLEIGGLNPVVLAFVTVATWLAVFASIRLGCGWTAKLVGNEIRILGPLGVSRIPIEDVTDIELRPKLFGSVTHLNLIVKGQRRFSAANANVDDAKRFASYVETITAASPATPPAI